MVKERTIYPIPLVALVGRGEKSKFTHMTFQGEDVRFGYYAWYVEDDGKKILIDAGGTAEMALGFGRPPETVTHIQTLPEGLAKLGVKPEEIDILILTHLHLDHIAYVREFPNARILVQKVEVEFAKNPHPMDRFYDFSAVEGLDMEILDGDAQITSHIRVMLTPGHTVGGQSVILESEAGNVVVTGFCCIEDNFHPEKANSKLEVIVPGLHHDVFVAYDSMLKVKSVADIIVQNHEAKFADIPSIP